MSPALSSAAGNDDDVEVAAVVDVAECCMADVKLTRQLLQQTTQPNSACHSHHVDAVAVDDEEDDDVTDVGWR